MTQFALTPTDNRKSFYNKAHVLLDENGNKYLKSYDTIVLYIDSAGCVHRTWNGYSATTQRHINSFLHTYGISPQLMGKKAFESMEVETL